MVFSYFCPLIHCNLRYFIAIGLFFSLTVSVWAQQNALLKGTVSDTSGKRLEFANVAIVNLENPVGTSTDLSGEFELVVPANRLLRVCVTYVNFQTDTVELKLKPRETHFHRFVLKSRGTLLPSVEIKDDYLRNTGNVQVPVEDLQLMTGPTVGVESIIKTIEGVSSQNELSSQYSVRGGNFDENLIYVNGIEIFRPFLIRSGQQEGLSFINTDMVSGIVFSSGGFEPIYGDKMSSVLSISYQKPFETFKGSASVSLLGENAHVSGIIGSRFSYQFGVRHKTNKYLFNALDTKGEYDPSFTDIQTYLTYDVNERTEIAFLGNLAHNIYRFVPKSRETEFGNFLQPMKMKIYFEGQEQDRFQTLFGALMFSRQSTKNLRWKLIGSAFSTQEQESFDLMGQYYLYETAVGANNEEQSFDRGIGTYLEHARNRLQSVIYNLEHKATLDLRKHTLYWGLKYQYEQVFDRLNEWKLIDSAGSTVPTPPDIPGLPNLPYPPLLLNVVKARNQIQTHRISAYFQARRSFEGKNYRRTLTGGARVQYATWTNEFHCSPRAVLALKPLLWKTDILFRLAAGVYVQPPFYREFRHRNGKLNENIKSQKSFHVVLSEDLNFRMSGRPFQFTTSIYYKYLWDLIPYEVDNIRLTYLAENNAVGYAGGIDVRLSGEFIEKIDSWISLSLMTIQEDIKGDGHGYIPRPTDHLFKASVYFQDYIPRVPDLKVNLMFSFSTGVPFGIPGSERWQQTERMRSYMRSDIGLSWKIRDADATRGKNNFMKYIKRIWLNGEVLNLFDNHNINSYLWVSDAEGYSYGVPNYLTPRQLNARLIFEF